MSEFKCAPVSTGAVLLADILPALGIKLIAPFALQNVPYLTRHVLVILSQICSFVIVAFSEDVSVGLFGSFFSQDIFHFKKYGNLCSS